MAFYYSAYYKLKNNERFALFTKELPVYAQLNLIVSTLLMLFFFENALFTAFNILITAALYISMVFVNKIKAISLYFHLAFCLWNVPINRKFLLADRSIISGLL